ncbi:hypothetical protein KSP39_PZI018544 [Platanthera zijinensis]|uniref:Uncharacterized protein n=1 Tax=Platanthera zijinensis TaxID=2320716 RepID=A0AAP0FZ57_9ASPA
MGSRNMKNRGKRESRSKLKNNGARDRKGITVGYSDAKGRRRPLVLGRLLGGNMVSGPKINDPAETMRETGYTFRRKGRDGAGGAAEGTLKLLELGAKLINILADSGSQIGGRRPSGSRSSRGRSCLR